MLYVLDESQIEALNAYVDPALGMSDCFAAPDFNPQGLNKSAVDSVLDLVMRKTGNATPQDIQDMLNMAPLATPTTLSEVVQGMIASIPKPIGSFEFSHVGTISNGKWLTASVEKAIASDKAPGISPAHVACTAVTYSNELDRSFGHFRFYIEGSDSGYALSVPGARHGRAVSPTGVPFFVLTPGQRISCKYESMDEAEAAAEYPVPPKDLFITCYFALLGASDSGEFWSETLSS